MISDTIALAMKSCTVGEFERKGLFFATVIIEGKPLTQYGRSEVKAVDNLVDYMLDLEDWAHLKK